MANNTSSSDSPITPWFRSGEYAKLSSIAVTPIEHPILYNTPLSIQKGQAESFCLEAKDGSDWILKKFYKAKALEHQYLDTVTDILPKDDAFIAGTKRKILTSYQLKKNSNYYYSPELEAFIDGTVLMPRIAGKDWACLADNIRSGEIQPSKNERTKIAVNLAKAIDSLEKVKCSHRDLSSGNVFIDPSTWKVYLIDFDSLYHRSLKMPKDTTCGTDGYISKSAWWAGDLSAQCSWCDFSDRFALAILTTEFLIMERGAPLTSEGGIFKQDELKRGTGSGITDISSELKKSWPSVHYLFEKAMNSNSYANCPSPSEWITKLESISSSMRPPKLINTPNFTPESVNIKPAKGFKPPKLSDVAVSNLKVRQTKTVVAPKLSDIGVPEIVAHSPKAPKLSDMPEFNPTLTLPVNPWN